MGSIFGGGRDQNGVRLKPAAITTTCIAAVLAAGIGFSAAEAQPSTARRPAAGQSWTITQHAKSATLQPLRHRRGDYWLTLRATSPRTQWTENRRGGLTGALSPGLAFGWMFGGGRPSPVGAVAARVNRGRGNVVLNLTLLKGSWNARTKTLRYLVRLTGWFNPAKRATPSARSKRMGAAPTRLGTTSLFAQNKPDDCNVNCSVINDLFKLGKLVSDFFTRRNTCAAGIYDLSGEPLTWVGDSAKSEDTWSANPARKIGNPDLSKYPYADQFWGWLTTSAWARGCWNNVTYKNSLGTVAIGVSDPYDSGNDWWCKTTGELVCLGPDTRTRSGRISFMAWNSRLGGDHITAAYCIARKNRDYDPCDRAVDD